MQEIPQLLIGKGAKQVFLNPRYANRHGLIAGATGTGKTISLQVMTERFSDIGVPVFLVDVKGDLSGLNKTAGPHKKITERIEKIGITDYQAHGMPTVFWDLFGELGHPIRATVSDMGPLLLARLLKLNDTQEGILNIAFKLADDQGLLLVDLKDLSSVLKHLGEERKNLQVEYGNISPASLGAIQRRLLVLKQQGAEHFFGETALDLRDLIRTDFNGKGQVNILSASKLINTPDLYATFLLWLLSELFEELPEVGDMDKPRFVMFFDEAHLLFADAPKVLLEKIDRVVKLIRSKGVGIYFVTQNPLDIPDGILSQLGNRIQHALRAYTPKERKAVRIAAQTFRTNPDLDTETVISELGVGEALVSVLMEGGVPSMVERTLICPPSSQIGPISDDDLQKCIKTSPVAGRYEETLDRESAYEVLKARAEKAALEAEKAAKKAAEEAEKEKQNKPKKRSNRQSAGEAFLKSIARTLGSGLGRQIVRGILGSIFKGK